MNSKTARYMAVELESQKDSKLFINKIKTNHNMDLPTKAINL